jgi:putative phage-type endonuclease
MKIHQLTQGSPEWHAYRAQHRNASDAPAMMGCSPYKTRAQLLREVHTGLTADVDTATQRVFDAGHRFEALARPLGEEIVGEPLYPVTASNGLLSASFDGLTFGEDVAFEHKTLNDQLRAAFDQIESIAPEFREVASGRELPLHYRVQMEQQLMVSGAQRVLFMASRWSDDGELVEARHCWYTPDNALRAQIVAGWQQFEADLAAYAPPAVAEPAQAEHMESLPAVSVRLDGALSVAGNLPTFAEALRAFIGKMPKAPATDNEFATVDAACKALKRAEDALDQAEAGALASITDVEAMRRAVADCRKLARDTRLAAEKLVERRKVELKEEAVAAARRALDAHVTTLNAELHPHRIQQQVADFAGAIKGKRSIASMQDALDTTLAQAKIAADGAARLVRANAAAFRDHAEGLEFLFADLRDLVHKPHADFVALVQARVTTHRAQEAAREAQRKADEAARIAAAEQRAREQEAARLAEQQRQQAEAERQAAAALAQASKVTEPQHPQQVLKAEPATADATDRGTAAIVSPRGGAMGAGQAAAAAPALEPATLKLGVLNERLAPVRIDAAGLSALGFDPVKVEAGAKLYRESDFPRICAALVRHIGSVCEVVEA